MKATCEVVDNEIGQFGREVGDGRLGRETR